MSTLLGSGVYWAGVATLPALALGLFLLREAIAGTVSFLRHRCGIIFEAKASREDEWFHEPTVRRDIWWERGFGPTFTGGWYREEPRYVSGPIDGHVEHHRLITRWVGLGSRRGPRVMVLHKRNLGLAPEPVKEKQEAAR